MGFSRLPYPFPRTLSLLRQRSRRALRKRAAKFLPNVIILATNASMAWMKY
jgi:hypothetical protein